MKREYLIDFDGVILDSQARFLEVMKDNVDFYDWNKYLNSINWHQFLRECNEIDESISTLEKLQTLKKIKGIITAIHSINEGQEKLIYLREKNILVPIYYVLPFQKKSDVFIPKINTVLVDDRISNCIEWESRGGTSLLFNPNIEKETKGIIKSLKKLL